MDRYWEIKKILYKIKEKLTSIYIIIHFKSKMVSFPICFKNKKEKKFQKYQKRMYFIIIIIIINRSSAADFIT